MVSVVIVSWNAKDYLAQCLESLATIRGSVSLEVFVVDNASADGSPEMVRERFPSVRLIQTGANLGFAKANNMGIRQCKGRYVCLVNSDIKVLNQCIETLVSFCQAHPEAGMVGPRIMGGDGQLQRSCRGFPGLWNMLCRALALDAMFPQCAWFGGYLLPHWKHDVQKPVDILSGCFWLVRREALDRVGLLDEDFFMYGEDMDWCKRFWEEDWQVVYVPEAMAVHYGGASSANAPLRFFIEQQRADLHYWKKHHSRFAQRCYFLISVLHHALRVSGYAGVSLVHGRNASQWGFKMIRGLRCLQWLLFAVKSSV
jgi:GT2 family glycosyltransferase